MADIRIQFRGEEYLIPETRAFEIGERIEQIAPLTEVIGWQRKPRFFTMARCIGEMLRFAGAKVTDKDVHRELIAQFMGRDAAATMGALFLLTTVLMGDAPATDGEPQAADEGEPGKPEAS